MWIIFDLDDTLIDTSGCVTPFKMGECLKKLIEEGLAVHDFSSAYAELLAINEKAASSSSALRQFLARYPSLPPSVAQKALIVLTSPLPDHFALATTPGAKEILEFLHPSHFLALVTGGHPPFQLDKLKKAGIDSSIFSKIAIPEDSIKGSYYEGILKEFLLNPKDGWVCGDRPLMDLAPAHRLGLKTIHMRWGRGAKLEREPWVDASIATLRELKEMIR